MELRPYQRECIETIKAQAPGAYLAQMATGLGKTVTFANIPRHGERMLILPPGGAGGAATKILRLHLRH